MSNKNYRRAVDWVVDSIQGNEQPLTHLEEKRKDDIITFQAFIGRRVFQVESIEHENEYGPTHYDTLPHQAALAIAKFSESAPKVFDYAIEICARNVIAGKPVPLGLRFLAADVLKGKAKRPTPRHRESNPDFLRLMTIHDFVLDVESLFHLSITRNDVSPGISACDAVAEGLSEAGYDTKYSLLKDLMVHQRFHLVRKQIEVARQVLQTDWQAVDWDSHESVTNALSKSGLLEAET
ncbi:hypothetical protein [Ovoidimarina sediminis]|uniref:hypothetical protein n=1 Tax=Ovoidimarina sediminis TaxID=3079856 RepID=UPI00291282CA|nr:hypothetical protein [Rhodophyticola sp. MJ-SS7]MDU8942385.1 hypothetical protein [Rhodophyticola sp. MJ-SS7]